MYKGYNACMGKALSFEEKLLRKTVVDKETGCWVWTGTVRSDGYGIMCTGSPTNGTRKTFAVHRVSYQVYKGELMEGVEVCHSCHNKLCVNPEHLRQDTRRENSIDTVHTGVGLGMQKLDIEQVKAIKQLLREGVLSQRSIAWMFNVTPCTINDIKMGRTWNWTEDRT